MTQTVVSLSAGAARHVAQPRAGRVLAALTAAMGAALLTGCVVPPADGGYGGSYGSGGYYESNTVVYTQYGSPPPPRVEYRTVAPYPDSVWVGGDWIWGGRRYDWHPGRWVAPRHGWREPSRPGWGRPEPSRPSWQAPPPRPRPERPQVQPPRPEWGGGARPDPGQRPGWGGRPERPRPEQPAPPPAQVRPQPSQPPQAVQPPRASQGTRYDRPHLQVRRNEGAAPAERPQHREERRGFRDRDRD